MSNDIQVFNEQEVLGKQFRIYGDADSPLFLAKAVAEWIDYSVSNVSEMLNTVDEDEKTTRTISTNGNYTTEAWFLTEEGLYEVLMTSRKPIAKQFKKKVKEILKDIRQHGMYMTDNLLEQTINNPDFMIEMLTKYKEEKVKRQQLELQVEEQKPLVTFAEKCIKTNDSILILELAKVITEQGIITIGEKKLYKKLREWGLILEGKTEPSQRAMNNGYFEVIKRVVSTPYRDILERTTRVKPKGKIYIVERLSKDLSDNNA